MGAGVALALALWPVLLALVPVALLMVCFRCGAGRGGSRRHPPLAAGLPGHAPVLDPCIAARALAQVQRINTEIHREHLERSLRDQ